MLDKHERNQVTNLFHIHISLSLKGIFHVCVVRNKSQETQVKVQSFFISKSFLNILSLFFFDVDPLLFHLTKPNTSAVKFLIAILQD